MEQNKKFNKLSIIALFLSIISYCIIITVLTGYVRISSSFEKYLIYSLFVIGLFLAIVSYFKIKKSGEKGKLFVLTPIIINILFFIFIFLAYFSSQSEPSKGPNAAMKSQLASMRAQAELYYSSTGNDESYFGFCNDSQTQNGLGGMSGPGLLRATSETSAKGTSKCFSDKNSWVVVSGLIDFTKPNTHYCTDSTGIFEPITTIQNDLIINADTLCPQQ